MRERKGDPNDETRRETKTSSPPLGAQPEQVGQYRILERIGEGGFGEVYLADQTTPVRRRVAIKILKAGMDTEQILGRFEGERQALALMDHPNIVNILDAGQTERGRPYFVMELVRGESITTYCDRHKLMPRDRLDLFITVCQAVQHAHMKGIIHRDLKSPNILVTIVDDTPVPKVIDFGIAKAMRQSLTERTLYTQHGQLMGTPAYMSPEQAEMGALDVDTRTDVYALGVVLYELLTDTLPFDPAEMTRGGIEGIQRFIREEDPVRPSTRVTAATESGERPTRRSRDARMAAAQLRGELDWITLKAMEKDRTLRYQTASELAVDVRRYLNNEPVLAGPPSARYRLGKFAKRNKVAIGIAGAVLFGIVGAAAGLTYALVESNRQRSAAEAARDESAAVTQFLSDMLSAVDPEEQGRDVSVREVLDAAADEIDNEFTEHVLVQAQLHHTIGATYRQLGHFDAAKPHLESALELRSRELGDKHLLTFKTTIDLARLAADQGHYSKAEALYSTALANQRLILGPDHEAVIVGTQGLATVYQLEDRFAEAESLLVDLIEVGRRKWGDEHLEMLNLMTNLADIYYRQQRYSEAESLYVRQLARARRLLGDDHPTMSILMNNLALTYRSQEKHAQAESLQVKVLEMDLRVLGEQHPHVHTAMANLGWNYVLRGRLDEAEPYLLSALEGMRGALGEAHPRFINTLAMVAGLRVDQGQYEEAEPLARRAVSDTRQQEHVPPGLLGYRLQIYGECLRGLGRTREAEAALLESHPLLLDRFGPTHERTVRAVRSLVRLYDSLAQPKKATEWQAKLPVDLIEE